MRKLNLVGVVCNGASALALILFFAYQRVFLSIAGASYVAELDRAGVFSEDRLRAYDPTLAQNLRYNVGEYITQDHERAFSIVLVIWAVAVAVNLVIFLRRASLLRSSSNK